jgi:hypothetical protein
MADLHPGIKGRARKFLKRLCRKRPTPDAFADVMDLFFEFEPRGIAFIHDGQFGLTFTSDGSIAVQSMRVGLSDRICVRDETSPTGHRWVLITDATRQLMEDYIANNGDDGIARVSRIVLRLTAPGTADEGGRIQ